MSPASKTATGLAERGGQKLRQQPPDAEKAPSIAARSMHRVDASG